MKTFTLLVAAVLVAIAAAVAGLWLAAADRRTGSRGQRSLPPAPRESAFWTLLRTLVVGDPWCF